MTVALDDLRSNRGSIEPKPRADALFVLRLEVAEGANRTGKLADAHILGSGIEADEVALHFRIPVEQLEAEGRGFGVDAVGTANGRRVLEFDGAAFEHGQQGDQPDADVHRCLFDLQSLGSINHIVRGKAIVQPAGLGGHPLRSEALGNRGGEGDDVVLHFRFDLMNAGYGEAGFRGNRFSRGNGNDTVLGEHGAGSRLYLEPATILVLFGPNMAHGRPGIALNQGKLLRKMANE